MATTNETENLQQSLYSTVQLELSQTAPSTVDYENYFKPILHEPRPENKPVNKNLAAYFASSPERFLGEFEAKEYTLSRGYIESNYQVRLFYSRYVNKTATIATLCIVHGFGEHSGRWIDIADHYVRKGFEVHTVDLRGFGHSGGPRFSANVENLHHDIEVLLNQANKNLPLFVLGHSMGGALVTTLLIRNPGLKVSGVILSSPMFDLSPERPLDLKKKVFIKALGGDLEDILLNAMISPSSLSKNNVEVKKAIDDRLMTPLLSMGLGKSLVLLLENCVPNARKFEYPFYIFHGRKDTLTSARASEEFFKQAQSQDKTLKIVENGYHEIFLDVEREEMLNLTTEWMNTRIKTAKTVGVLPPMKLGFEVKKSDPKKKVAIAILVVVYLLVLRKLRGNPLLKTNLRWLLFPLSFLLKAVGLIN